MCGASAALATSTVVPSYERKGADVAFAVIAANAVSTLAMLIYPLIAAALGYDPKATGIFLGALATDVHLTDTYFVVAHFHYVMMGGTVFAFVGGLHYWWPKITGRMYNETAARVGFARPSRGAGYFPHRNCIPRRCGLAGFGVP